MNRFFAIAPVLVITMLVAGCSSQESSKTAAPTLPAPSLAAGLMLAENRKHPLAKYLEVVGIRPSEAKQGKLSVRFGVVNHSDADIADLGLTLGLKPTTAKAGDPPFCTFSVKVLALPPQELVNAQGECTTALRVYELPDWQFIRATYTITSPQP